MKPLVKSPGGLQKTIFRAHVLIICGVIFFLSTAGIIIDVHSASHDRDHILVSVAEMAIHSPLVYEMNEEENDREQLKETFDALSRELPQIDKISIVGADGIRRYHTDHELIGKPYEGQFPSFSRRQRSYATNGFGASGAQRRAYGAIYDDNGIYQGFVVVLMLRKHIHREVLQAFATFSLIAFGAFVIELLVSFKLSEKIKERLMGFEPDAFSAMYKVRDGILESLEEGVVAVDEHGVVQFTNRPAEKMLGIDAYTDLAALGKRLLGKTLKSGERESGVPEQGVPGASILVDRAPIRDGELVAGAVAVLHDRTEYVKLAEDLSGARFLVDSMRANNHDFTNKLHVILGLLQMKAYDQAASYIEKITFVQREGIGKIVRAIEEPAVAALIIGKTARAAELNVKLILQEGSVFHRDDISLPPDALVTIVGNLIENALEAMNACEESDDVDYELLFGIYSKPGVLLISVDDNGPGIPANIIDRIFEHGFTTKGEGHGNGLYQVKNLVESLGGSISVESTEGVGTSFSVSFQRKDDARV